MIKLTPKHKRNLGRIIPFGIIWLIIGWSFLWTEYAVIAVMDEQSGPPSAIALSPTIVLFASVSIFFIGCFVGVMEVMFINRLFVKSSLPQKVFGKFLVYAVLMMVLIFVFFMLAASIEMKESVFSQVVFNRYKTFFFSITNVSTAFQLAFSLVVSLLYSEISDNLGQGVLHNFFLGKYHKPIVENRIFMFTDMKQSTSIAEKLGHIDYFRFLRTYYEDLSDAIINNYGEVYQYIGDEIVISWKLSDKKAVKKSIKCFYAMKRDLASKKDWYLKTYGVFPEFKGGIHLGEVTTGEIGALKKEIFFTGDVLNTTARIQALCTTYKTDLLVSGAVAQHLDSLKEYNIERLGEVNLKGKNENMILYFAPINE